MGFFDSRRKTVVGTSVTRAIPDNLLPNAVQTALLEAIFEEGRSSSIGEYVVEQMLSSLGPKIERMYEYARDNYTYGLPSSDIKQASQHREAVDAVLTDVEGGEVLIEYANFGPPNILHLGWYLLSTVYGYNQATNEIPLLTTQRGKPIYLWDMQVVIPASDIDNYRAGALDQWGHAPNTGWAPDRKYPLPNRKHSPVIIDPDAETEHVRLTITWLGTKTIIDPEFGPVQIPAGEYETIILDISELANEERDYFQARYTVGSDLRFFLYRAGQGTYPTLDQIYVSEHNEATGSFFPWAYFRFNKADDTVNTTTPAYQTTKRMLEYIGMDYDDVADAINQNPDIADVEQAMLMLAVPATTSNQLELRYLYQFFENLYELRNTTYWSPQSTDLNNNLFGLNPTEGNQAIVIQDKRFSMTLLNEGIYRRQVVGSIGAIGSYSMQVTSEPTGREVINEETGLPEFRMFATTYHIYRKQVSPQIYEEIRVANLQQLYRILNSHSALADETDDILLIPLDKSITEHYSISEREELYARSMHFVFNSVVVIKVKWYQTAFFLGLMLFFAIVITIVSYGSVGRELFAAIAAGGIGLQAAIINLLIKLLFAALLNLTFRILVKAVGIDAAFTLAILAALSGGYQALSHGSVQGAPWASELLQLASGLVRGVQAELGYRMGQLRSEAEKFQEIRERQDEALAKANELLEVDNRLNPFVIFGESPEDYYNRTVHSGNIGIVGISAISSFVDNALRLPKLNDTTGDFAYV